MAYSSASPELMASVDCEVAYDFITWLPHAITPPLVDFIVDWSPAQSESAKLSTLDTAFSNLNFWTIRVHPFRYLPTLLSRPQLDDMGFDICLDANFEANCKSGLSGAR